MFGVMVDCSRNSVLSMAGVKKYIDILSSIGYDTLMLYTEDTYEVINEPYFGYLRGRYSIEEIKEIDEYASSKGIELIPCIQTLAHLNATFHWWTYRAINDIDDILLIDDPRTYELIDNMFKTLASCVKSRKLHIGMDEAHNVGVGRYQSLHGPTNRFDLLLKHLNKVVEIANRYGFSCMMWSDMFYRLLTGGDYYKTDIKFDDSIKKMIPDGLSLVYWDYYHDDVKVYDKMFEGHKNLTDNVIFAGGTWTWAGFAPDNKKGLRVTIPAMESCKNNGIKDIIITQWKDNGGECSIFANLPTIFAARQIYDGITDLNIIKDNFYKKFSIPFDMFMHFDLPNFIPELKDTLKANLVYNPSKYMLYNDPLLGICDSSIFEGEGNCYKEYTKMFKDNRKEYKEYYYLADYYGALCNVLYHKVDLGVKTRRLYKEKNKKELAKLIKEYKKTIKALDLFIGKFRISWNNENKPHGFDVQEIRLGGLRLRLESSIIKINNYVKGKVDSIPELEEELLNMNGVSGLDIKKELTEFNCYKDNATVNIL